MLKVRRDFLSEAQPTIRCGSGYWRDARLRVVPVYKHLGGLIHHRGGLQAEVRARTGHAWTAFRKHWPKIVGQAHIPSARATWPNAKPKELAPLVRCYHSMLLHKHFCGDVRHVTEDRVRALVYAPSVDAWLHFHRLSYLASFVALNVKEAWALIHAEKLWLLAVQSSLAWLHDALHGEDASSSWQAYWDQWKQLIASRPKAWKGMLRRALRSTLRRDILREGWQQCRQMLLKCLQQAGAYVQSLCDAPRTSHYFCGVCCTRYQTRQQWAVHAFKRHGIVKPTRVLTPGSQCPACLKQYATNVALCNHLDRTCRLWLVRAGFTHAPQPGVGHSAADYGLSYLGAVRQGYGPLPREEPTTASTLPCHEKVSAGVLQALCDVLSRPLAHVSVGAILESLSGRAPDGL